MEQAECLCTTTLISNIGFYLTNNTGINSSVIKVNNHNLSANGELCFSSTLKAWEQYFQCNSNCPGKCRNVLEHCLHLHNSAREQNTTVDVINQVSRMLVSISATWAIKIEKCILQKERVCLFLNRICLIRDVIMLAIEEKINFGRNACIGSVLNLTYNPDEQSELTTMRMRIIMEVTKRILDLQGYEILDQQPSCTYIFTTKSQGNVYENFERYLCGVVKNAESNSKEIELTWTNYICNKHNKLIQLNEHKFLQTEKENENIKDFYDALAIATGTFELLSVKPSRPVLIHNYSEVDKSITNTKGVPFVLYNTARITSILESYNKKVVQGQYTILPKIDIVDFSQLDQEEEWELVYNFIFGYPQMIKDCLRHKPNFQIYPHLICLFLLRLCQKFSTYYSRVKILTEGRDHLTPKIVARIYLLQALQIVLHNALSILNITPVCRM